jgi:hypothetical protein
MHMESKLCKRKKDNILSLFGLKDIVLLSILDWIRSGYMKYSKKDENDRKNCYHFTYHQIFLFLIIGGFTDLLRKVTNA